MLQIELEDELADQFDHMRRELRMEAGERLTDEEIIDHLMAEFDRER